MTQNGLVWLGNIHCIFTGKLISMGIIKLVNVNLDLLSYADVPRQIKGIPVLFIPGNAGSYKQVRPIAAEAAQYWYDYLQHDAGALSRGAAPLDIFTVDFNEDLTAFHGQTVLDQAEYLNAAISYILGIYTDPTRALRRDELVDPASVIIIAHSMGGIVARTMFTVPNYQPDSINTLITMSTPHARAPVSFDGEMIRIYDRVNKYWRDSFLRPTGAINPLAEVALISIAGGSLDRVVASDYASIASLVPATHGFTSYTSTVPEVWTESDHLSILWCDQFRKVIVKSIFDVVDGKRKSQTHPLAERLASLRKRFLTGMELRSQRRFGSSVPSTLLTIEQRTSTLLTDGASLSLRLLGDSSQAQKPQAYMIPLNHSHAGSLRIQLLTDQSLDSIGDSAGLEVFLCSMSLPGRGHTQVPFQRSMDLSGGSSTPTRLACTNVASEAIQLPASNSLSVHPFDEGRSMSHLQFNLSELSDFEYVVIVDKHLEPTSGWLLAEIADYNSSMLQPALSLPQLIRSSFHLKLPVSRSLVTTVQLPAMHSSLLAYVARLETGECAESEQSPLYQPLLRHYRSDPYESHYHVNAKELFLSMHGTAPFMPLPLEPHPALDGNSLEVWTDPTCANNLTLTINLDIVGSLGKLVMRYRTVFAAFPLFVVSIVLWKQFRVYDESGK